MKLHQDGHWLDTIYLRGRVTGGTALERIIDEVTGQERVWMEQYLAWLNQAICAE